MNNLNLLLEAADVCKEDNKNNDIDDRKHLPFLRDILYSFSSGFFNKKTYLTEIPGEIGLIPTNDITLHKYFIVCKIEPTIDGSSLLYMKVLKMYCGYFEKKHTDSLENLNFKSLISINNKYQIEIKTEKFKTNALFDYYKLCDKDMKSLIKLYSDIYELFKAKKFNLTNDFTFEKIKYIYECFKKGNVTNTTIDLKENSYYHHKDLNNLNNSYISIYYYDCFKLKYCIYNVININENKVEINFKHKDIEKCINFREIICN